MGAGIVVEARVNPDTRAVETTREEVSEFLVDILDRKVNGVALGIFEYIIHYFCYWFSSSYSTLYTFKAHMLEQEIPTDSQSYEAARIFRFNDGTPFYDFSGISVVVQDDANGHVAVEHEESGQRSNRRVLFDDNALRQPLFSQATQTAYLFARHTVQSQIRITESRLDGSRNWQFHTRQTQPRSIRGGPNEPVHIAQAALPAEASVDVPRAAAPAVVNLHGETPNVARAIANQLQELYGFDTPPPLVLGNHGLMIFNASGKEISYQKSIWESLSNGVPKKFEGYRLTMSTNRDNKKSVLCLREDKEGLCHVDGHLQLDIRPGSEDFVVITDNTKTSFGITTTGYRIQQPGKHDILVTNDNTDFFMTAKLEDKKPLAFPIEKAPQEIAVFLNHHILSGQNREGMSLRRVASGVIGLDVFYYGRQDIKIFGKQFFVSDAKGFQPGLYVKSGEIYFKGSKEYYPFYFTSSHRLVLVTDFVNPRKPKEQRYLVFLNTSHSPFELYFPTLGNPTCRIPKLEEPKKAKPVHREKLETKAKDKR